MRKNSGCTASSAIWGGTEYAKYWYRCVFNHLIVSHRYFSDFQDMNHIGLKNGAEAPRQVTLKRSKAGFGFQMRGANCK